MGGGDEFHAFELTEVGGVACSFIAYNILGCINRGIGEQFTQRLFEKKGREMCAQK